MAGMWLSVARFKGGMLADARRCKRCPDYCVLLDWVREPYRDTGWFKKGKPGRWVPDRTPPFLRDAHNTGESRG